MSEVRFWIFIVFMAALWAGKIIAAHLARRG